MTVDRVCSQAEGKRLNSRAYDSAIVDKSTLTKRLQAKMADYSVLQLRSAFT